MGTGHLFPSFQSQLKNLVKLLFIKESILNTPFHTKWTKAVVFMPWLPPRKNETEDPPRSCPFVTVHPCPTPPHFPLPLAHQPCEVAVWKESVVAAAGQDSEKRLRRIK